ncbi:metallophosphoesterase family protein [Solibacillus sp. CAU 1738]|uniref:metallophosphoesterase family protein n=1 Tax=Solibacillus sp. CAU 1738 TaxID=3140363 RepID=UPI00326015EA
MTEIKFAILTDIHGNAEALKAVLRDIKKRNVQEIYCTGDLIAIGHQTNEVLEILTSLEDCFIVTGNHDDQLPYPKNHEHTRKHHEWILNNLDQQYIPFLKKLPREIIKQFGSNNFLFTHYALKNKDLLFHEGPFESIKVPSLANMETLFKSYPVFDCIFFGHHHPRQYFKNQKTMYVNPGALGCNSGRKAKYAICTINNKIEIELNEVEFDYDSFIEDFKSTDIPEKEFILNTFFKI